MARGLLVFDLDQTLICEEGIDCLAREAGKAESVAQLTERAMAGELDFASALEQRVALLKGLPIEKVEEVANSLTLTEGAVELIRHLKQADVKIGIASGGFLPLMTKIRKILEPDFILANQLEYSEGRLTGELLGSIVTAERKKEAALDWLHELGLDRKQLIAVGDGANDIPLLQAAGIGIAFCAKPIVRQAVPYQIDKRDLMLVWQILMEEQLLA